MKVNRYRAAESENLVNYGLLVAAFIVMAGRSLWPSQIEPREPASDRVQKGIC
jgi:hypothetical protein